MKYAAAYNNAAPHVLDAYTQFADTVPYLVTGLGFDNGSEFINYDFLGWLQSGNHPTRSSPGPAGFSLRL